jgi:hypothetical protein
MPLDQARQLKNQFNAKNFMCHRAQENLNRVIMNSGSMREGYAAQRWHRTTVIGILNARESSELNLQVKTFKQFLFILSH